MASRQSGNFKDGSVQVRAYIAALPPAARRTIKRLQATLRAAAPRNAEDAISYRIPALRVEGRILLWYAAFTEHCSVFPISAALRRAATARGFETSKGTLRLPLDRPLPVGLLKQFVRERVAAVRTTVRARKR